MAAIAATAPIEVSIAFRLLRVGLQREWERQENEDGRVSIAFRLLRVGLRHCGNPGHPPRPTVSIAFRLLRVGLPGANLTGANLKGAKSPLPFGFCGSAYPVQYRQGAAGGV